METLELALSFVSGGLVVKVLDWIQISEGTRAQQRLAFLRQQVSDLYGPLYLLARQNEQLLELSNKINTAYSAEFSGTKWSENEHTQKTITEEAQITIDVNNRYASQLVTNTKAMRDVIRNNLWMSEADDRIHFEAIIQDMTRLETELGDEVRLALPFRIFEKLGNISFTRGDNLRFLIAKYNAKRAALDEASESRWSWLRSNR